MKLNVRTPDRIARLIIGVLLLVAPFVTGWALFTNPLWTWIFVRPRPLLSGLCTL